MTSYFDVHLNKASGMSMTLAAIGPIIYPPIITILLKFYGVEGCIWILSAISLNIFAAALLLQPVKWHMKRVEIKDTEMQLLSTEKLTESNPINNNTPPTSNNYYLMFVLVLKHLYFSCSSNVNSRRGNK